LKKRHGDKTITVGMIAGEMGLTPEQVVAEMTPEFAKQVNDAIATMQAAKTVFGEMADATAIFKAAKAAMDAQAAAANDAVYGEMMTTKIPSETVRKQVTDPNTVLGKMWAMHKAGIAATATKDEISGEMDKFLADTVVKSVVDAIHTDKGTYSHQGGGGQGGNMTGAKRRSASI
jgi:hypothetical protein